MGSNRTTSSNLVNSSMTMGKPSDFLPVDVILINPSYYQQPSHQIPQQGAYNQAPAPSDPNAPYGQGPPGTEGLPGERGILGAIAGGVGGHAMGNKFGGHGILGTLAGAYMGHKAEDALKHKHHQGHQNYSSGLGGLFGGQQGGHHGGNHHGHHHHKRDLDEGDGGRY